MKRSVTEIRNELFQRRDRYRMKAKRLSAFGSFVGSTVSVVLITALLVFLPMLKQPKQPSDQFDSYGTNPDEVMGFDRCTEYTYDESGRCVREETHEMWSLNNGKTKKVHMITKTYEYDGKGRLSRECSYELADTTPYIRTYSYQASKVVCDLYHDEDHLQTHVDILDDSGNVIETYYFSLSDPETLHNHIGYTYNSKGQLIQKVVYGSYGSDDNHTTYEYNEDGLLIREIYAPHNGLNGGCTEYQYDAYGNEIEVTYQYSNGEFHKIKCEINYDAAGRMTSRLRKHFQKMAGETEFTENVTAFNSYESYEYLDNGNVIRRAYNVRTNQLVEYELTDSNGNTLVVYRIPQSNVNKNPAETEGETTSRESTEDTETAPIPETAEPITTSVDSEDDPQEDNSITITRSDGKKLTVTDAETIERLMNAVRDLSGTPNGTTQGYYGFKYLLAIDTPTYQESITVWAPDWYSVGDLEVTEDSWIYPDMMVDENVAMLILRLGQLFPYDLDSTYRSAANLHTANPALYRDIGELESETQNVIMFDDGQYYQTYTASTHDMVYVFVSDAERGLEGTSWDWVPIGTVAECSIRNLGLIEEGFANIPNDVKDHVERTEYEYDEFGRLVKEVAYQIKHLGNGYYAKIHSCSETYKYDSEGRLLRRDYYLKEDRQLVSSTLYSYKGNTVIWDQYYNGNYVTSYVTIYDTDANEIETYYTNPDRTEVRSRVTNRYSSDHLLIERCFYDDEGNVDERFEYLYDDSGKRIRMSQYPEEIDTEYRYDSYGNLVEEITMHPSCLVEKKVYYYVYDSLGRIIRFDVKMLEKQPHGDAFTEIDPINPAHDTFETRDYLDDGCVIDRIIYTETNELYQYTLKDKNGNPLVTYILANTDLHNKKKRNASRHSVLSSYSSGS